MFKVLKFEVVETVNGKTVRLQLEDQAVEEGFFFVHLPRRFLPSVEANFTKYANICVLIFPFRLMNSQGRIREIFEQRKRRQDMSPNRQATLRKKATERRKMLRSQYSEKKKDEVRKQDRERRKLSRLCKKVGNSNLDSGLDVHQTNFDIFMSGVRCSLFTKANNMDPGELPNELKDLSYVEQQLIAKVHPVVSVFKIKKGEQLNLSNIITVRVSNCDGFKDFNVRKSKVRNALLWLKEHNPYYCDVEISSENLDLLPENGDVYLDCRGYDADDTSRDKAFDIEGVHYVSYSELNEEELESIDLKDVPNLSGISEKDKVGHSLDNNVLLWPSIGVTPINEFGSPGYIAMAFPHLFPFGTADYSNRENNDISLCKYIQHLMLYFDERFSKDPRFRFFMMNSQKGGGSP
ncbi:Jacalin-related lectin 18 [Frankliniella fusca]|uniref:Jacalin-related lectin 18 n=1 Tax=Frankliniella fusca TaxID=407009 RepID=A0AAE1LHL4_9NEOP|nr:Jacalin-related lectin 18 [Frankliniella fusca]